VTLIIVLLVATVGVPLAAIVLAAVAGTISRRAEERKRKHWMADAGVITLAGRKRKARR